jgi:GntR family transcriptional regulator
MFSGAPVRLQPGPVALHHQIYLHLRAALDGGRLQARDRLPGERELCDYYGASMVTVRRALDELVRERRLVRMRGRGTFVTEPPVERDLAVLGSFTDEMRELGLAPATTVLETRVGAATGPVAAALDLPEGAPALLVKRLRLVDGQPLLVEEVHLPADRFPGLLGTDLERESLYEVLARRFDTAAEYAQETVAAVGLPAWAARLLGKRPGTPSLQVDLTAYDQHGRPFEFCRTLVGHRVRYTVGARRGRGGGLQIAPRALD